MRFASYFDGMYGLGDNVYQRAVLRELPDVYIRTPWPQLYTDLPNVKPVMPSTTLRTQSKNMLSVERSVWHKPPYGSPQRLSYVHSGGTMLQALRQSCGVASPQIVFDLPIFRAPDDAPYIVVRPATVRSEWRADARNPLPQYLAMAVEALAPTHRVVSVADLEDGREWLVGDAPYADVILHRGELGISEMLGLVRGAAAVIGGVGWLAPAAVAYRVPMLLLFGGWGFHNGPQRIFDPRMDLSTIQQVVPDRFCMCTSAHHECDKTISNIRQEIDRFASAIALRRTSAMAA